MYTFDGKGELEAGEVLFQVKATDRVKIRRGGRYVTVRVDARDWAAWCAEPMPVILVLYDGLGDSAFWLYVQASDFKVRRRRARAFSSTITVRIPKANVLNATAIERCRALRDRIVQQTFGVIRHHE
jgi:hypothetical protein